LGLAIARALLAEGAEVTISSRNADNIATAVAALKRDFSGAKVRAVAIDLGQESSVRAAFSHGAAGEVDILVNSGGGPASGDALDLPLKAWDEGYQTLIRSLVVLSQLVVPGMKQRQWGRILVITSTSAAQYLPGLPISGVFRAGITSWTKAMAKTLGKDGILVNNLLPGPTRTARLEELKVKNRAFFDAMEHRSALGRIGEPDEIGRIGAFLCSAANSYITGTDILADGGATVAL
jgi:3-oxoacyl-[acyl-carrier protein] reductase